MRWSEKQLAVHLERTGTRGQCNAADTSAPPFHLPPEPSANAARFALGRLKTGEMNKTEARYDEHLWQIRGTVIAWHKFEGVKLRLADNTFYTPDFAVMLMSGELEMHETKGHWQDDAKVKIKVAASLYPFRFIAVKPLAKKAGGGWAVEEF